MDNNGSSQIVYCGKNNHSKPKVYHTTPSCNMYQQITNGRRTSKFHAELAGRVKCLYCCWVEAGRRGEWSKFKSLLTLEK